MFIIYVDQFYCVFNLLFDPLEQFDVFPTDVFPTGFFTHIFFFCSKFFRCIVPAVVTWLFRGARKFLETLITIYIGAWTTTIAVIATFFCLTLVGIWWFFEFSFTLFRKLFLALPKTNLNYIYGFQLCLVILCWLIDPNYYAFELDPDWLKKYGSFLVYIGLGDMVFIGHIFLICMSCVVNNFLLKTSKVRLLFLVFLVCMHLFIGNISMFYKILFGFFFMDKEQYLLEAQQHLSVLFDPVIFKNSFLTIRFNYADSQLVTYGQLKLLYLVENSPNSAEITQIMISDHYKNWNVFLDSIFKMRGSRSLLYMLTHDPVLALKHMEIYANFFITKSIELHNSQLCMKNAVPFWTGPKILAGIFIVAAVAFFYFGSGTAAATGVAGTIFSAPAESILHLTDIHIQTACRAGLLAGPFAHFIPTMYTAGRTSVSAPLVVAHFEPYHLDSFIANHTRLVLEPNLIASFLVFLPSVLRHWMLHDFFGLMSRVTNAAPYFWQYASSYENGRYPHSMFYWIQHEYYDDIQTERDRKARIPLETRNEVFNFYRESEYADETNTRERLMARDKFRPHLFRNSLSRPWIMPMIPVTIKWY